MGGRRSRTIALLLAALLATLAPKALAQVNFGDIAVPSGSYTTTQNGPDHNNSNGWQHLVVTVNITAIGTGSITPTLQVKDLASGVYVTVATATAALIANATSAYYFGDSATIGASGWTQVFATGLPPGVWRVQIVANNANPVTYSVSEVVGQ